MTLVELQTDSAGFTAEEATSAVAVDNVDGVIETLKVRQCLQCSRASFPTVHEQLRRSGVLYWRVLLACSRMHEETLVFKVGSHQLFGRV